MPFGGVGHFESVPSVVELSAVRPEKPVVAWRLEIPSQLDCRSMQEMVTFAP